MFSRLDTITVQMGMNIYRIIDGVSLYFSEGTWDTSVVCLNRDRAEISITNIECHFGHESEARSLRT